jgi:regulator of sigma E protease
MIITILIAFISLIGLIVLHEFGHFILAKKFGVKVEEFGIGYPPRIIGKKIGETIYSLNLLPFGAFVKIYGEEAELPFQEIKFPEGKEIKDKRSFSQKPIWQRVLIVLGGVFSFWVISAILLSIVMVLGAPIAVSDETDFNLKNPKVQIVNVTTGSPAQIAGLKPGDTIKEFRIQNFEFGIQKVKDIQSLTEQYKGKEIILTIERGKEVLEVSVVPRLKPPAGEGPMGITLVRTAIRSYPWYLAPWKGILGTFNLTIAIIQGWGQVLNNLFKGLPSGAQVMGPVGIFALFTQMSQLGAVYFLQFIAVISIYLAVFNILPIPSFDGGKLLFLGIEAWRKKPVSPKIEQNITTVFFTLLIGLMIWVTIKDIIRIF